MAMKKQLLTLLLLFGFFAVSQAQFHNPQCFTCPRTQVCSKFFDDFEGAQKFRVNLGSGLPAENKWSLDSTYAFQGRRAILGKVTYNTSSGVQGKVYYESDTFCTYGNQEVFLNFAHICKISPFDTGFIEISTNGGPWVKITCDNTATPNIYEGNTQYVTDGDDMVTYKNGDNFVNSASYPTVWRPGVTVNPQISWYKREKFDISGLAANAYNVKFRFALVSDVSNPNPDYGWLIDSVHVTFSLSEIIPPVISHLPLTGGQFGIDQSIPAVITDRTGIPLKSGVKAARVLYKVNGGGLDSVAMTRVSGDNFTGFVARPRVQDGDTVEYYLWAQDSSFSENEAVNAPTPGGLYKYWVSGAPFVEWPGPGTQYPNGPVYTGDAYLNGPPCLEVTMDDASGLRIARLYYRKNNGPLDSMNMTYKGLNPVGRKIYEACITGINANDSVTYWAYAVDSSARRYFTYMPNVPAGDTPRYFIARQALGFPFRDDVDSASQWSFAAPNLGWHRSSINAAVKAPINGPARSGNLVYITDSTSNYRNGSNYELISPVLSFLGITNATLSFYQWRDVNNNNTNPTATRGLGDAFTIEYSENFGPWLNLNNTAIGTTNNWYNRNNFNLYSFGGFDGTTNGWVKSEILLTPLDNKQNVRLRFLLKSNATLNGAGVAIDDIAITRPVSDDMGVFTILRPGAELKEGAVDSIFAVFRNNSGFPIPSSPVGYKAAGRVGSKTITFRAPLLPYSLSDTIFVDTFTAPRFNFNTCVYTQYPNDPNPSNDSFCVSTYGVPSFPLPFFDNFDTVTNMFVSRTENSIAPQWQLGTPVKANINSSFTAPNCWVTQTANAYSPNAVSTVYSPYFDFSTAVNTKVSFYQNRAMGSNGAVRLQYTLNNGLNWFNLGTTGVVPPNGQFWYNAVQSGEAAWTGNSGGWVKSELRLPSIFDYQTAPVRFRFILVASSAGGQGFAFDNFSVQLPPAKDAGVISILSPAAAPTAQPTNVTIQVQVKNFGRDTLYQVPINYVRRSGPKWLATNYIKPNDTLAPGAIGIYDVTGYTSLDSFYGVYNLCIFTDVPNDGDLSNDTVCRSVREIYRREAQFLNLVSPMYGLCTPAFNQTDVCVRVRNNGHANLDSLTIFWPNGAAMDSFVIPSAGASMNLATGRDTVICMPGKFVRIAPGPNNFYLNLGQLHDGIPTNNSLGNITITGTPMVVPDTTWNFDGTNPKRDICQDTVGGSASPSLPASAVGFNGTDGLEYTAGTTTPAWTNVTNATVWGNTNMAYRSKDAILVDTRSKTNIHIKFRLHQVCTGTGTLRGQAAFRITANGVQASQTYLCYNDPNMNNLIDVDLSPYYQLGKPLVIGLESKNSPATFSGTAGTRIDDITVYNELKHSAKANAVITIPPLLKVGDNDSIKINIKNTGVLPLTKVQTGAKVNGNTWPNQAITGLSIQPGDSFDYVYPFVFQPIAGLNDICVWTLLPNDSIDQNRFDDTLCYTPTAFDTINNLLSTPYCNDFDSGKPKWVTLNAKTYQPINNDWQEGAPSKNFLDAAFNGTNAWVTELDTLYSKNTSSALFTPIFGMIPGRCYDMTFMHKFDMDTTGDGGTLEFTVDNGNKWEQFGAIGSGWFNQYYIPTLWDFSTSPNLFGGGWTGKSSGWVRGKNTFSLDSTKFTLPNYSVIFRFRFSSDFTIDKEGWAIDSFCLSYAGSACKPTSVRNLKGESWIVNQIYPNPTSDRASWSFALPFAGRVVYHIQDVTGKVIEVKDLGVLTAGQNQIDLNTSQLSAGAYFITLQYQGLKTTQKLMIAK